MGAKTKLGFINGTCLSPLLESPQYPNWKIAYYMVLSWLLNSILKDISLSFMFENFARDLWLEIEARFGESNGPLIYQLQRETNTMTQGNQSVTSFVYKFKTAMG